MSKPDIMNVRFKVYESADGSPYLGPLEDGPETNSVLNNKTLLAINLNEGTSFEDAKKLCDHLNKYATTIGLTFL